MAERPGCGPAHHCSMTEKGEVSPSTPVEGLVLGDPTAGAVMAGISSGSATADVPLASSTESRNDLPMGADAVDGGVNQGEKPV